MLLNECRTFVSTKANTITIFGFVKYDIQNDTPKYSDSW